MTGRSVTATGGDRPPSSGTEALRRSPLHERHVSLGARLVPFAGWEMPLAYDKGTVAEHRSCRRHAVAFDVSHLGTVRVQGSGSLDLLQRTLTNDLAKVSPGRAQYTHLLDDDGSVVDDLIVWWLDDEVFDVMPNASNTVSVRRALGGVDTTGERAVIAVQGPMARRRLLVVSAEAASVGHFCVSPFSFAGARCLAAGTGYTGEDGVECAVPSEVAVAFFDALLAAGIEPAGLGARDTLRLEAGLPLHGHELGPGITPLQAGLGWVVGWKKETFVGRAALEEERRAGPHRLLQGMVADSRRPLRDGATVVGDGRKVGRITSGNYSPMLERGIGLGFLDGAQGLPEGTGVVVELRGQPLDATITKPPFFKGEDGRASPEGSARRSQ